MPDPLAYVVPLGQNSVFLAKPVARLRRHLIKSLSDSKQSLIKGFDCTTVANVALVPALIYSRQDARGAKGSSAEAMLLIFAFEPIRANRQAYLLSVFVRSSGITFFLHNCSNNNWRMTAIAR
jgi:hypothetical protein